MLERFVFCFVLFCLLSLVIGIQLFEFSFFSFYRKCLGVVKKELVSFLPSKIG